MAAQAGRLKRQVVLVLPHRASQVHVLAQPLQRQGDRFVLLTGGARSASPRRRTLPAAIDRHRCWVLGNIGHLVIRQGAPERGVRLLGAAVAANPAFLGMLLA